MHQLICFIIIILMLPWGGYAAATSARALIVPSVALMAVVMSGTEGKAVPALENSVTKVFASKRCRISILPSFPCRPDPALPLKSTSQWQDTRKSVFSPNNDKPLRERFDPPLKQPPRSL